MKAKAKNNLMTSLMTELVKLAVIVIKRRTIVTIVSDNDGEVSYSESDESSQPAHFFLGTDYKD